MGTRRRILLTVGLLAFAGTAFAFWPSALGGATTYVSTFGSSMEPTFHHDDLVLVRPSSQYDIGDVVAYRSELLDTVVLHRIVERDGDRFVLQGDNNSWLDGDRPGRADVIGKAWLSMPNGGRALGMLRTAAPALAALLVLTAGGATTARTTRSRTRTRNVPAMRNPMTVRSSSTRAWRTATIALAAIAGGSLLVALAAFVRPTTEPASETFAYGHRGQFGYSAVAPAGPVYDDGQVQTGDPVFLRLVRTIAIDFAYDLDADAALSVTGTITLHAEIGGANGWRHDLVLGDPAEFTGADGIARADLDIGRIESLTDQVEELTGVTSGTYDVSIVPHVTVDATLGGEPLEERFEPRLAFQLDAEQLRLVQPPADATDEQSDVLAPVANGTIARATEVAAELAFRDWAMPVPTARLVASVIGGLAAIAALLGAVVLRRRLRSAVARIELRYGDRIVPITEGGDEQGRLIVDVSTMDDLAKLAQQHDTLILLHQTDHRSTFFFEVDGRVFRYTEAHRDLRTVAS